MSSEMLPSPRTIAIEEQNAEQRRAVLEQLNAEAATADAARSREIMIQGRVIASALEAAKAPFEEARLAGKASVLASRRLGRILAELPSNRRSRRAGTGRGSGKSARGELADQLGVERWLAWELVALAGVHDPVFQRYVQDKSVIPTVAGALRACGIEKRRGLRTNRRRTKLKRVASPSLDSAYADIIDALSHLDKTESRAGSPKGAAVSQAMRHLWLAEDLLKPYRAGYDGTGRKAA